MCFFKSPLNDRIHIYFLRSIKNKIWLYATVVFMLGCSDDLDYDFQPIEGSNIVELPIIFHLIDLEVGDEKIEEALDYINESFRGKLDQNSIDTYIQFRLATSAPDGSKLIRKGVNIIDNDYGIKLGDGFWKQELFLSSMWNPNEYVNIWVGVTEDTYNWTLPPYTVSDYHLDGLIDGDRFLTDSAEEAEGILLNYNDTFGGSPRSFVFIHELGHFLGLKHPFKGGLGGDNSDHCSDTHHYDRDSYLQNTSGFQRVSIEGITYEANNFMDSWYCRNTTFTVCQIERMRHVLSYSPFRNRLRFSQK